MSRTFIENLIRINYFNELEINYKHPISDNEKIELGYDGDIVSTKQSMDFQLNGLTGINDFDYNRSIHAIYFEYDLKITDKFSIKPSARYELVNKKIKSAFSLTC